MADSVISDLLIGVPALLGSLCFLVAAVSMNRARDALTRINILSVATGLGMMLFIVAAYVHDLTGGFRWSGLIMALVAFGATVVVTSVASITLARAAYRADPRLDPRTAYDDLSGVE
ncbi:cation:proton antiporter [Dietzia sp. NPDC055343]